jgi:hypothetical protein
MSGRSSDDNGEPWGVGDWVSAVSGTGDMDEDLALEVARIARARLIDVEVMLRDFWYDSIDHTPLVAARISVAARLAHQAAEALAPETLL